MHDHITYRTAEARASLVLDAGDAVTAVTQDIAGTAHRASIWRT